MLEKYIEELKKIKLLTIEEERLLWQAVEKGDEEARMKIILSYQPLVFKTALSFNTQEERTIELLQEGMVGLMEAMETFDYKKGVAFSIFAIHRIKGRMIDFLKKYQKDFELYLDYPVFHNETMLTLLADTSAGPEEIYEENTIVEKVKQAMQSLSDKEQKVLEGIYLEHISANILAKDICVSQSHVYKLQKKAIKRVRGMLSKFIKEMKW